MRSLCTTRAPTLSVVVLPPGGVLWLSGLTAVAVPTSWAKTGDVIRAVPAKRSAMVFSSSMLAPQNLSVGPALTCRSRMLNTDKFDTIARYCTRAPK